MEGGLFKMDFHLSVETVDDKRCCTRIIRRA